jgi:hypothetical protein
MTFDVIGTIIEPAEKFLPSMASAKATMMLLAIGLQESRFEHRRQIGGPARGYWQFEQGGGVRGVLLHKASSYDAAKVCHARGVGSSSKEVYERLEHDDILACCFARLLLYTDPKPLPMIGDAEGSWDYYIRNWRPGKPHRKTWDALYQKAHNMLAADL